MNLFGDSDVDKRDLNIGLAGLLASVQCLRILAENGIASSEDVLTTRAGVMTLLKRIPAEQLAADDINNIERLLTDVQVKAIMVEKTIRHD